MMPTFSPSPDPIESKPFGTSFTKAAAELMREQAIEAAIRHPSFSHSRRGDGCWRDVVWIYHRDENSPSGFRLAESGDASLVEPVLRRARNTSPLSPTERERRTA